MPPPRCPSCRQPRRHPKTAALLTLAAFLVGLTLLARSALGADETNPAAPAQEAREADDLAPVRAPNHAGELEPPADLNPSQELAQTNETIPTNRIVGGATAAPQPAHRERTAREPGIADRRPPATQAAGPAATNSVSTRLSAAVERTQTNAPAGPGATAGHPDFASFKIIPERNIFDPNRTPHQPGGARPRPKSIESFALVGTMSYSKGTFAFFNGTSSDYRKALKSADTIAGYKVLDIEPDAVELAVGTNKLELRVGMQMRREEGGDWLLSTQAQSYAANTSASASANPTQSGAASDTTASPPSGSSGGDLSEVEKRMMQRRDQQ